MKYGVLVFTPRIFPRNAMGVGPGGRDSPDCNRDCLCSHTLDDQQNSCESKQDRYYGGGVIS